MREFAKLVQEALTDFSDDDCSINEERYRQSFLPRTFETWDEWCKTQLNYSSKKMLDVVILMQISWHLIVVSHHTIWLTNDNTKAITFHAISEITYFMTADIEQIDWYSNVIKNQLIVLYLTDVSRPSYWIITCASNECSNPREINYLILKGN